MRVIRSAGDMQRWQLWGLVAAAAAACVTGVVAAPSCTVLGRHHQCSTTYTNSDPGVACLWGCSCPPGAGLVLDTRCNVSLPAFVVNNFTSTANTGTATSYAVAVQGASGQSVPTGVAGTGRVAGQPPSNVTALLVTAGAHASLATARAALAVGGGGGTAPGDVDMAGGMFGCVPTVGAAMYSYQSNQLDAAQEFLPPSYAEPYLVYNHLYRLASGGGWRRVANASGSITVSHHFNYSCDSVQLGLQTVLRVDGARDVACPVVAGSELWFNMSTVPGYPSAVTGRLVNTTHMSLAVHIGDWGGCGPTEYSVTIAPTPVRSVSDFTSGTLVYTGTSSGAVLTATLPVARCADTYILSVDASNVHGNRGAEYFEVPNSMSCGGGGGHKPLSGGAIAGIVVAVVVVGGVVVGVVVVRRRRAPRHLPVASRDTRSYASF